MLSFTFLLKIQGGLEKNTIEDYQIRALLPTLISVNHPAWQNLPSCHKTLKRRHLDVVMTPRRRDNVQMTSLQHYVLAGLVLSNDE